MILRGIRVNGRDFFLQGLFRLVLIFFPFLLLGDFSIAEAGFSQPDAFHDTERTGEETGNTENSKKPEEKKDKKNPFSGSVGAGLSMTSGNSETINWNLSFDVGKKTKNQHDLKLNGLYLRGKENGKLSLDRLKVSLRDDYSINDSIVGYGNVSYKSDPLKGIDYLVNPAGGLGWKIQESDKFSLQADIGAGFLLERDRNFERKSSLSINSNQSFTYRLSKTARLRQKLDVLWKADNLEDYLVNASISLATKVTAASELQAEFLDDFKNKPADIAYKKNDIALILKYVVRF